MSDDKTPNTNIRPGGALTDKLGAYSYPQEDGEYVALLDEDDEEGPVGLFAPDGSLRMVMSQEAYTKLVSR